MKKIVSLLAFVFMGLLSYTLADISIDSYPICERNLSGVIGCPSLVDQVVPENKLVLLKDFCPEGDRSVIIFDQTCQFIAESHFVRNASGMILMPFGDIKKYLKLTRPLEDTDTSMGDEDLHTKDEKNTDTIIKQQFLKTGAGDENSSMIVILALGAILSYFALGFAVFKK